MLKIKDKRVFEGNCWTGIVDCSQFNSSQEARIKAITDIASITKGRLGFKETPLKDDITNEFNIPDEELSLKNQKIIKDNYQRRHRLYNHLLTESGGKPSTPFEFIPVRIDYGSELFNYMLKPDFINKVLKYSYYVESDLQGYHLLTNLRVLLKAGIDIKDIPFNTPEEVEGFKIIVGRWPKSGFDHILRHGQIRPNAESSRNKKYLNEVEFHYPSNWTDDYTIDQKQVDYNLLKNTKIDVEENKCLKPEDATKELSCRRLMLSAWQGWIQDENTWNNLFTVRGEGTGTQNITAQVVDSIKTLIK